MWNSECPCLAGRQGMTKGKAGEAYCADYTTLLILIFFSAAYTAGKTRRENTERCISPVFTPRVFLSALRAKTWSYFIHQKNVEYRTPNFEQRSQHNHKKIMRTQPYLKSPLHITKPNILSLSWTVLFSKLIQIIMRTWISPSPH